MKKFKATLKQYLYVSMLVFFTACASSIATMLYAVGLPTEKHVEINNRYLNWPEKECYTQTDLDMIIEGP